MKKTNHFLLIASLLMILSSCMKDRVNRTYTLMEAVYMDKSDVLASINSGPARSISSPGKIYKYGSYIFLNEINKGVHVIDNSNPRQPNRRAFINIPGNIDIAVKGNILYADLYTDLLAIDISNPLNAQLTKVLDDVFPERRYANGFVADTSRVIVNWIERKITVSADDDIRNWNCPNCLFIQNGGPSIASAAATTGTGGSMARFSIVGDHMYAVNAQSLNIIDVNNSADPVKTGTSYIGPNIETIYPFRQKLFIGSSNGMFIYDISNPANPVRQGTFSHARACDPVVADDQFAYVTLRTGNFCLGVSDQLDVIDVTNLASPQLLKTYEMTNPFGVAIDGELLFVCDNNAGLKVYDRSDPLNHQLVTRISHRGAYDVIALNGVLLLVTKEGLYQYDYTDASNIKLLSRMTINSLL